MVRSGRTVIAKLGPNTPGIGLRKDGRKGEKERVGNAKGARESGRRAGFAGS